MDICERMIAEYSGSITFKILHHDHNRGLSAARNTGTNAASGEYIYYLDSDDEITPDCITILSTEITKHPDVACVQGSAQAIPYDKYYDMPLHGIPHYTNDRSWICRHFFSPDNIIPITAWNKLVSKRFLKDNNIFFENRIIHEDVLWSFLVFQKLPSIAFVETVTYIRNFTEGSITATVTTKTTAKNMGKIHRIISHNIDNPYADLQLFKSLNSFVLFYPKAWNCLHFWVALPRYIKLLLSLNLKKTALRLLLFTIITPVSKKKAARILPQWTFESLLTKACYFTSLSND